MNLIIIIKFSLILIISLLCSFQDIKAQKISNFLIFFGCFMMIIFYIFINPKYIPTALLSAALIFLIFLVGKIILKNKLGNADIFFSIFIGLSLPYIFSLISIIISLFLSLIFLFIKYINIKKTLELQESEKKLLIKSIKLPFIPFLSLGLITVSLILFFNNKFMF